MTRRPDLAVVLMVALLAALVLVLVPREAPASAPFPTRVQVTSTEFRLTMSRVVVPGGRVRIELVNMGEDPHDLKLRRIGGKYTYTIPETLPGERATKTLRLIRGRYQVWCAIAGHRDWGMRATLRVVPRR
jgi:nitrite reductase (NO-forming)